MCPPRVICKRTRSNTRACFAFFLGSRRVFVRDASIYHCDQCVYISTLILVQKVCTNQSIGRCAKTNWPSGMKIGRYICKKALAKFFTRWPGDHETSINAREVMTRPENDGTLLLSSAYVSNRGKYTCHPSLFCFLSAHTLHNGRLRPLPKMADFCASENPLYRSVV